MLYTFFIIEDRIPFSMPERTILDPGHADKAGRIIAILK